MIKKLRVTVDGKTYDVVVEMADEPDTLSAPSATIATSATPVVAAAATPPPVPAAPAPVQASPARQPGAGPGDVPSPLAGRVTAVVVQLGQEVKEGEHLLTLEAMKMNTFVFAPRSGKISELKAAVGDAVEEGQALMKIQ